MIHKYWVIFLSLVLFGLAGCETMKSSPAAPTMTMTSTSGENVTEADNAIRNIVMQYEAAVNVGDVDTLLMLYAGNAVQVAPNEPSINGAQSIRMRAESNHNFYNYNLNSTIDDVQISGNLATVRASFSETMISKADISDNMTTTGIWVLLLQRQPGNIWKIATEIWNDEKPITSAN